MGLFSSSKSSASTTVSDQSIQGQDAFINVGGGTQGDVTVLATSDKAFNLSGRALDVADDVTRNSMQLASNLVDSVLYANTNVLGRSLDSVDLSLDLVGNSTENALAFASDTSENLTYAYETYADNLAQQQAYYTSAVRDLKSNEQLGEVTQVKDIVRYAAYALVAIFIAPAIIKKVL